MLLNPETIVKEVVHISRHWHSPQIQITLHSDGIALEMSLEDFCKALAAELPHPLTTFTRKSLQNQVSEAIIPVLEKIKQASIHV